MEATCKQNLFNPFEGRDAEQVWKELLGNLEPVSHAEMIRQIQEETKKKQNKADDKD